MREFTVATPFLQGQLAANYIPYARSSNIELSIKPYGCRISRHFPAFYPIESTILRKCSSNILSFSLCLLSPVSLLHRSSKLVVSRARRRIRKEHLDAFPSMENRSRKTARDVRIYRAGRHRWPRSTLWLRKNSRRTDEVKTHPSLRSSESVINRREKFSS